MDNLDLSILEKNIKDIDNLIIEKKGLLEDSKKEILNKDTKIEIINSNLLKIKKSILLMQKMGVFSREQIKTQVEKFVTMGLQYVFQDEKEFVIEYKESRNRPVANFYIAEYNPKLGKKVKYNLKTQKGGGVIDTVDSILRITLIEFFEFKGSIVLDEPIKHLDAQKRKRYADFIKRVAIENDRKFIISTHKDEIKQIADTAYECILDPSTFTSNAFKEDISVK